MTKQAQSQNGSGQQASNQQRMSRTKLLIIISMAFGPILVAYIVFFKFPDLAPTSRTNEGTLISPPVQGGEIIPANSRWTLLIAVDQDCDKICQEVLYLSRQIHISLGKNTPRVQRVVLTQGELSTSFKTLLETEHGSARVQDIQDSEFANELKQAIGDELLHSMVFLMDPNGNVMMFYSPDKGGNPMLKDLKLLLKLSNIG